VTRGETSPKVRSQEYAVRLATEKEEGWLLTLTEERRKEEYARSDRRVTLDSWAPGERADNPSEKTKNAKEKHVENQDSAQNKHEGIEIATAQSGRENNC